MIYFIILDFFWSGAAWIYDLDKLLTIPPYFWPLVAVCPIYPFLLALVLLQLYRKRSPNQFLLAFATVPSVVFGFLALLYYPLAMYYQGFSWNALGQIFWVWFYAGQGVYLMRKCKINRFPLVIASVFMILLLVFEFYTKSFGYFDFGNIPDIFLLGLVILATSIILLLSKLNNSDRI